MSLATHNGTRPSPFATAVVGQSAPVAWDYRLLCIDKSLDPLELQQELNVLGDDGWELVTCQEYETHDSHPQLRYVFKRPR
jgi:hypothetical protein